MVQRITKKGLNKMELFILIISLMIATLLMIVSNANIYLVIVGLLTVSVILTIKEFKEDSNHDIK